MGNAPFSRVAIFPCGSEIGLEIWNALRFEKDLELHGLSSQPCHGQAVFAQYCNTIPWIAAPDFLDALNRYIDDHAIEALFPAYDDVILFLARNRERLNCRLIAPEARICAIARSKRETYAALAGLPFVPRTFGTVEEIGAGDWPVFAKPDIGQGSQGVRLLHEAGAARDLMAEGTHVFCEYLSGPELTVDSFSDQHGRVRSLMPRERLRTKSGISVRTRAVPLTDELRGIAEAIQARIGFTGAWFFQVKQDAAGAWKLLEVAPRIGGSMGLSRNQGANLPLLSLYAAAGMEVAVAPQIDGRIAERYLGTRYVEVPAFGAVYIDYDDTITCRGLVNSAAMAFLYNCRNRGIALYLITRFAGDDIRAELRRRGIGEALFSDIIHITDGRPKSGFITRPDAIFIDDSFAERQEVARICAIPVHAPDALESLTDWRLP